MANDEKKKEPDFYPLRLKDHGWVLKKGVPIERVGEAYRDMIYQLVTQDFVQGSVAETMYRDAMTMMQAKSEKAKKAAEARWNGQKATTPPNGRPDLMPNIKQIVVEWAIDNGYDADDAGECWEATAERNGRTADGKLITNWKGYVASWCETRKRNRNK